MVTSTASAASLASRAGGVDGGFPPFQPGLNLCPDGVGQLAHHRPLLRGELAHLLQDGGKLPLFAKELHPKLLPGRPGRLRRPKQPQGAALDVFQLLFHCDPSPLLKARRLLVLIGMARWGKNKKASVPMGTKEIPPRYHPQFAKRRTS